MVLIEGRNKSFYDRRGQAFEYIPNSAYRGIYELSYLSAGLLELTNLPAESAK